MSEHSNRILIIALEGQVTLLERLIKYGKKGDMERIVKQLKARVKEIKDGPQ